MESSFSNVNILLPPHPPHGVVCFQCEYHFKPRKSPQLSSRNGGELLDSHLQPRFAFVGAIVSPLFTLGVESVGNPAGPARGLTYGSFIVQFPVQFLLLLLLLLLLLFFSTFIFRYIFLDIFPGHLFLLLSPYVHCPIQSCLMLQKTLSSVI
jgi:hypothetical protein